MRRNTLGAWGTKTTIKQGPEESNMTSNLEDLEEKIASEMIGFASVHGVQPRLVGALVHKILGRIRDQVSLDKGHYSKSFDAVDKYLMPGIVAANSLRYTTKNRRRRTSRRRTSRR